MDWANQKIFESFEIRPTIESLRSCFPGDSQLPTTLLHRFPLRHKIECTKMLGTYIQLIVGAISQLRIQLAAVVQLIGEKQNRRPRQSLFKGVGLWLKLLMKVSQMNISTKPKRKQENSISQSFFVEQEDNNSITSHAYVYTFCIVYTSPIRAILPQAYFT